MSKKATKKRKKSNSSVSGKDKSARRAVEQATPSEPAIEVAGQPIEAVDAAEAVTDEPQIETVTIDDLDEEVPKLHEPEDDSSNFAIKPTFGAKVHSLNVRFPWLKVVLLLLLVVVSAVGMEEILRHNVQGPPVNIVTEDQTPAEPVEQSEAPAATEASGVAEELPAEEEIEQPETSAPEVPQKPAPQPQTPAGRKLIALTFDDGPSPTQTPRLLQILAEKNVKVTFFALGSMAVKSPDVLRSEAAGGHEVASHTMTHANLIKSSVETIQWEVTATNETFTNIIGTGPKLTRPPYGNINANVRTYVNQPLILWSVDPEDWKYRDVATVRANVVGAAFDGAIILLHDIHSTTVDAVPSIIDDLKAAGYEFVTVSELAAARGVVMTPGASYGSFRP